MTPTVTSPPRTENFTRFAWGVLGANLLVILWGAFVRASGSGAGCGSHWPLCNGEVVPHSPQVQTIIEFTHRIMSGAAFFALLALAMWGVRLFPSGHRVRKALLFTVVFFVAEAVLGAGLVLLRLVGRDDSGFRAFYLAMHLVNTEFLLAALAITAWWSRDSAPLFSRPNWFVAATLPLAILVSISGVIAALGDTLFPATSLAEGIRQDLASNSNFLLRLRSAHPFLAVFSSAYFIAAAFTVVRGKGEPLTRNIALGVVVVSIAQLCAGAVNIALLAPIPLQILHLLLADLLWIALVLLTMQKT
ncbi:MAG TPA: COX15/CtaA family protein [Bryobacteraceae bacterium]|nr:COX15/CtaA family protein [Bryobacteraceae bacterium]